MPQRLRADRVGSGFLTAILGVAAAIVLPVAPAFAQATYSYGGSLPFTDVQGAYTTSDRVSGGFTLRSRLAPNLPAGTDITAEVLSYSLGDGVQTLTAADSYIINFNVATDSFCNITQWEITVWQGDDPVAGIDTNFSTGPFSTSTDQGFQGVACSMTSGGRCVVNINAMAGSDYGARSAIPGSAGTWSGPSCPEAPPAAYSYGGSLPFDDVQGAYTMTDEVTAGFTIPTGLAPNLPAGTDISAQVLSFSFDDGVQTLTEADAYVVGFRVGTDSFCNITQWSMIVWQGDDPVAGVDTRLSTGLQSSAEEKGFQGVPCSTTSASRCVAPSLFADMGTDYGIRIAVPGTAGTWSGPSCPETPPATYSYGGSLPFTDVQGAYTMSDRVSGGFTIPNRLAPNLPAGTDISAQVLSFSFDDGVQTLTEADSYVVGFRVGTDSFCNITQWSMAVWQGANPVAGISTRFSTGPPDIVEENGFQGAPCGSISAGRCAAPFVFADTGTDYGIRIAVPGTAGTWSGPSCRPVPIPTLNAWGLALLIVFLGSASLWAVSRRVSSGVGPTQSIEFTVNMSLPERHYGLRRPIRGPKKSF